MAAQPAPLSSITVGDIHLTYLPDGEMHAVATAFFPTTSEEAWQAHRQWLDDDGRIVANIGGFLIESGDRKILVDTGFGEQAVEIPDLVKAWSGKFLDSLKQTGVTPDQVDTVIYTHLHADHCGGTSQEAGGQRSLTFPNARHLAGTAEWEHWVANPDAPFAPDPVAARGPLENRLETTSDGQVIAPGVNVRATPGHTPGHVSVVLSSGPARAIILGDVFFCPAQLAEPEFSLVFDVDPTLARRIQDQMMAELEGTDIAVACGHFAESVFGRVLQAEGRRAWSIG